MKTLKVEAVYLVSYETFEDVTGDLPRSSRRFKNQVVTFRVRLYLSLTEFENEHARQMVKIASTIFVHPQGCTP